MIWSKNETLPRSEIEKIQLERLQETVRRVYEKVLPYRKKMDAAGVKPEDIKTLADLAKLPFTTKEDLRESKQLANDAEAVLMMELTKPGDYDSERELRVVKNKDGSLGKFWMKFEPRLMRFTPCDKPEHLKRQEYNEQMKKIAAERKQQKAAGLDQVQFTELPNTGDLPF